MNEEKDASYRLLEIVIRATADFDRDFKGSGHIEKLNSYAYLL